MVTIPGTEGSGRHPAGSCAGPLHHPKGHCQFEGPPLFQIKPESRHVANATLLAEDYDLRDLISVVFGSDVSRMVGRPFVAFVALRGFLRSCEPLFEVFSFSGRGDLPSTDLSPEGFFR